MILQLTHDKLETKKLQWKNPNTDFGEDSILVTLGAMHTEVMLWTVLGDWLNGSYWVTALTKSGIASNGKVRYFICVNRICRTRYMHQVSVAALYNILSKAYDSHIVQSNRSEMPILQIKI